MNKQQGSAHVILVVLLVVSLLGALGFIFWQNFIRKDELVKQAETVKATEQPKVEEKQHVTDQYVSDAYTFEYLADGWVVSEVPDESEMSGIPTPEVKTLNYAAATGMGIDAGALVAVYATLSTSSWEEERQNRITNYPGGEDFKDVTLGGLPAISFSSGYEGDRYLVYTKKDDMSYTVVYRHADTIDQSVYRLGYDTIVESFKFK